MPLGACDRAPPDPVKLRPAVSPQLPGQSEATKQKALAAVWDKLLPCGKGRFRLEPTRRLSVGDFTKLGGEEALALPGGGLLAFRPFDYEDYPIDGDWGGMGVVYARGGDPKGSVVGGVLWGQGVHHSDGGGELRRTADGLELTVWVEPQYSDPEGRKPVCRDRFVVKLALNGAVSADGQRIGTVH